MRFILSVLAAWLAIGVAHADWYEASGRNVRVLTEGRADAARKLAEQLERFDAGLRVLRGIEGRDPGPANRLTVYLLDDTGDVARLNGRRQVAGFYIPRAGGSVAFVPRSHANERQISPLQVLLHEYTHHFMFRNFSAAFPSWFVEGFAEFHATATFGDDGSVDFGAPAQYRAYSLFNGPALPIDKLFEQTSAGKDGAMVAAMYARGWLLTHYLTFNAERRAQLGAYLVALNAGKDNQTAGREAFGDLRKLDRELNLYMRGRFNGLRIGADKLKVAPVAVRTLDAGEAAMMDVHIASTRGVDRKKALALLPAVRRAAAPYPAHGFAQAVLAEAEYDAGNYAESAAAAGRSIAADPKNRDGYLYLGMAQAALLRAQGNPSEAAIKAVRAPLSRANRLDPDDPRPMLRIYDSFAMFRQVPPQPVKDALIYAHRLAPEDRRARMLATMAYIERGDFTAARTAVAPLAFDPHSRIPRAVQLLAALDAGPDQARAALRGGGAATVEGENEGGGDGDGEDGAD